MLIKRYYKVQANLVPAAAVRQDVRALFGIVKSKRSVDDIIGYYLRVVIECYKYIKEVNRICKVWLISEDITRNIDSEGS